MGMLSIEAMGRGKLSDAFHELFSSRRGRTYLIDGDGQLIYDSTPAQTSGDAHVHEFAHQAISGTVGAFRSKDPDGQATVTSYAPVPGTPWGLVSEESWAGLASSGRGYQR